MTSAFKTLSSYCYPCFPAVAMAGNIVLEGNYQGKNLYVKNPLPERALVSVFLRLPLTEV